MEDPNAYQLPPPRFIQSFNNLQRAGTNAWTGRRLYEVNGGGHADSLTDAVERAVADFERAKEGRPPVGRNLPPNKPVVDHEQGGGEL